MAVHDHWQHFYTTRLPTEVGWYEEDPAISRRRVGEALAHGARSVIDVGGGASFLVDHLLDQGLDRLARQRCVTLSKRTVEPGGSAVMATFAPDGPERCSGLPVQRFGPDELALECGPGWRLSRAEGHRHTTPRGVEQRFVYAAIERMGPV